METSFNLNSIKKLYENSSITPTDLINDCYERIEKESQNAIWISLRDKNEAIKIAEFVSSLPRENKPLWGIPFSVKDNIDVAGLATTAACPKFSYIPEESAPVVKALEDAGAICLGKTNLDQFATGLNGTRSPYGACSSAFNSEYVSGGSSSGSALSVAKKQVCFSLGTDTGGSGRIPAALNNIIGLKPTKGTLSTKGFVPCCPSLDCPSVFALSVNDALEIANIAFLDSKVDESIRYDSKRGNFNIEEIKGPIKFRVPKENQRYFFGNKEGEELYEKILGKLQTDGAEIIPIDFSPFLEAGQMLFDGPWVAERYSSLFSFLSKYPNDVLDTTLAIIKNGQKWSGKDVFEAQKRVNEIKVILEKEIGVNEFLLTPTVGFLCKISELKKEPISSNSKLGYYSYFANILDLSAISVPTSFYENGMPFGVTIFGKAFEDSKVAFIGESIQRKLSFLPGKESY